MKTYSLTMLLAFVVSYVHNQSLLWAFIHFWMGAFYLIYSVFKYGF